jgi:hypothetical protein
MYVYRNNEARLCNHCCSGRAISITHSECVFVALGIQHATHISHTVICGLSGSTIFSTLSHKKVFTLQQATKAQRESRGITLPFL